MCRCALCHQVETDQSRVRAAAFMSDNLRCPSEDLGALLLVRTSAITNAWAHAQCLFWSPDVRPWLHACKQPCIRPAMHECAAMSARLPALQRDDPAMAAGSSAQAAAMRTFCWLSGTLEALSAPCMDPQVAARCASRATTATSTWQACLEALPYNTALKALSGRCMDQQVAARCTSRETTATSTWQACRTPSGVAAS